MPGSRTRTYRVHSHEARWLPLPCISAKNTSGIPSSENNEPVTPTVVAQFRFGGTGLEVPINRLPRAFTPLPNDPFGAHGLREAAAEKNEGVALRMIDDAMTATWEGQCICLSPSRPIPQPRVIEIMEAIGASRAATDQIGPIFSRMMDELIMSTCVRDREADNGC